MWERSDVTIYNEVNQKDQILTGWVKDGFIIHRVPRKGQQSKKWVLTQILTGKIVVSEPGNLSWYKKVADLLLTHSTIAQLRPTERLSTQQMEDFRKVSEMWHD